MFFLRMIRQSLRRRRGKRLLVAAVVCLSATVSVAMLGVVFDVGDKLTAELSTYGSNITVKPKADVVVADLYGDSDATDPTAFLKESDAVNVKTIFWSYNITAFAPELHMHMTVTAGDATGGASSDANSGTDSANGSAVGASGTTAETVGTWFSKTVQSSTGESTTTGVSAMRSWWKVEGGWAHDGADEAMVGSKLAESLGVGVGDTITVSTRGAVQPQATPSGSRTLTVTGVYESGDDDDNAVYLPSSVSQAVNGLPDAVDEIEVKALTTPDNDLARRAAKDPQQLSQEDWETWYCTAYASSIAYQIEEVIPGAVAKQVRQVQALEGTVLSKTQAVMIVMTALTLIAATIAVANLMASSIGERSSELALLKALGAKNGEIGRLILGETGAMALLGLLVGALLGSGVAQLIGRLVFSSSITMRPMVFVLVAVLIALTVLVAALASIRSILRLHPAEVLHGR